MFLGSAFGFLALPPEAEARRRKKKRRRRRGLTPNQQSTLILQRPPFAPTDNSLFSPVLYNSPDLVPAPQTANDETTLRNELRALLEKRFGTGASQVNEALTLFDGSQAKEKVPHPRLRASFLSLKGTVGEPAIDGVLNGPFDSVTLVPDSVMNNSPAQVRFPDGSTVPEMWVNEKFQYEDISALALLLVHESLHQDNLGGGQEELVASAVESLVYGQFLLERPALATSGTELTRRMNSQFLARLNTRDTQGKLRLLEGNGNVYPGSANTLPFFAAAFDQSVRSDSPGNPALQQMLGNVVGSGVTVPAAARFDDATINLLDQNQKLLSPYKLVQLARILKLNLNTPAETTQSDQAQEAMPTPSGEDLFPTQ